MVEAGGVEPPFPDKKSFKNNISKHTGKNLAKNLFKLATPTFFKTYNSHKGIRFASIFWLGDFIIKIFFITKGKFHLEKFDGVCFF